jgi:hypothetical protein
MSDIIGWFFGCLSVTAMLAVFIGAGISVRRDHLRQRIAERSRHAK